MDVLHGARPRDRGIRCGRNMSRGAGVPCLMAIAQDATPAMPTICLCLTPRPSAAGAPGIIETTFREECETDLFGEQSVLCGGLPWN